MTVQVLHFCLGELYTHIRIGVGCNRSSALSEVLPSTLAKLLTLGAGHRVAEPPEISTNLDNYFVFPRTGILKSDDCKNEE